MNDLNSSEETVAVAPPPQYQPGTFSALRNPNYQLYFGGQLVSNIGTWMQIIAQGWVVYQIGHSEITLGLVAFASAIPNLLFTPWGGVIVDRVSRRTVLYLTQLGSMLLAFAMAVLTFTGVVKEWHIIILAGLLGIVNAFDAPARQTFIPEIVERKDVPNAIALNSIMFNIARVLGPAFAGLMLVAVGSAWCFTINGISFLAVILGLWLMKLPKHLSREHPESPWRQLVSGMQYTARHREISALILLSLIFCLFGISYSTVMPAFVEKNLDAGALVYGWINTATGLGAITGAFILAHRISHGYRGKLLLITNIFFPLTLIAFSLVNFLPASLFLAFFLGTGFMLQFTTLNTLLQNLVEDAYRGRVLGLYTLTFFGFAPFGNLMIGFLGETIGLAPAMQLFAILSLLLSQALLQKNPGIRKLP